MNELVFVYGTLRRGEYNHHWLRGSRFLGAHRTDRAYRMYDLGAFPAVVAGGCVAISGEVFSVSPAVFAGLDRLEEYPTLYTRELIPTPFGEAWIYLLTQRDAEYGEITEGDWLRRRLR